MLSYPIEFKKKMVSRMTGPDAVSATALSRETGISQTTLSHWLRQATTVGSTAGSVEAFGASKSLALSARTAEDKFRLLTLAASMNEEELGALLRREGLYQTQLDAWKMEAIEALSGRRVRDEQSTDRRRRIQELEHELTRKEKALAETAALLVLQKKVRTLLEGGDESTPRRSVR
jgi:transposase